uniref:Translation initiation factor eIF-4F n=1 Tax=Tetraselmis sp. GSL018 TaxID=582737 RepID=A0A061S3S1_9CHLO|mmetsp:Transcript_6433/g.15486  ORF Transcript_6433/g.15486 Transcript_6433/m.15486 type:complete len:727 (+) Transcript_6433:128-2308(+)
MQSLLQMDAEDPLASLSLRPGGTKTSLFSGFGKGAGFSVKPGSQAAEDLGPSGNAKPDGPSIKYPRDFLLSFAKVCTQMPPSLEGNKMEIFDTEAAAPAELPAASQAPAKPSDSEDWRAKEDSEQPTQSERGGGSKADKGASRRSEGARWTSTAAVQMDENDPALKIQKAADLGREAWMPGQHNVIGQGNNLRKIKGILNKLTPETFERLLGQMVELITSAEILRGAITYIFENAVAQPTFVQMYADLCDRLSRSLPEFPPVGDDPRPQNFRRVLLNTCQEEYEGAVQAQAKLIDVEDPEERLLEERKVKMRLMGNVRLISYLYKISVVSEKIILVCVRELLGQDQKLIPPEENIEAVCEMITVVGGTLAASSRDNAKKSLEAYMSRLDKLAKSPNISSRVRFIIKDIQDMRHNNWVPRRESQTAKKISEVRTEAQAELGMYFPGMQTAHNLPELALPGMSRGATRDDHAELLPSFKSDGWETVGRGGKKNTIDMEGRRVASALVGEYIPVPARSSATAATPSRAPENAAPSAKLTPEALEEKAKSLLKEYISAYDIEEALLCIKELNAPEFMPKVVQMGLEMLLDCVQEKEHAALIDLLVNLSKRNACTKDDLMQGLRTQTDQLDDLRIDVPLAPKLLGRFLAEAMAMGVFGMDALRDACNGEATGESKQALTAETFKALKARGEDPAKLAADAGVRCGEFLEPEPEEPPLDQWLASIGFPGVPV